jgi:hypothetical protein
MIVLTKKFKKLKTSLNNKKFRKLKTFVKKFGKNKTKLMAENYKIKQKRTKHFLMNKINCKRQ